MWGCGKILKFAIGCCRTCDFRDFVFSRSLGFPDTSEDVHLSRSGGPGAALGRAWSRLAARSGADCSRTGYCRTEEEAAELLGIPEDVMQVGLLPVAYTLGTDFKPARRQPLDEVVHWEQW